MARPTWDERERPILEAIAEVEAELGDKAERIDTIADRTGIERRSVLLGLRALIDAAYVSAIDAGAANRTDEMDDFLEIYLLERGRRATQQWPAENAGEELLELIRERAESADGEEERSRWQRLLDAAKGLGGRALTELAIALMKREAGL